MGTNRNEKYSEQPFQIDRSLENAIDNHLNWFRFAIPAEATRGLEIVKIEILSKLDEDGIIECSLVIRKFQDMWWSGAFS